MSDPRCWVRPLAFRGSQCVEPHDWQGLCDRTTGRDLAKRLAQLGDTIMGGVAASVAEHCGERPGACIKSDADFGSAQEARSVDQPPLDGSP